MESSGKWRKPIPPRYIPSAALVCAGILLSVTAFFAVRGWEYRSMHSWGVLASGLALTSLLSAYLAAVRRRSEEVAQLAAELSAEVEEHRRTEERLLSLKKGIETMRLGITITDMDGKILYTNPADARMHGYRAEELIGREARTLAPPGLWKPLKPDEVKGLKGWERESLNVGKDGSSFPVRLISNVVTDAAGEPIGVVTCCEDITDRKRAEEALRRSEEKYRSLVENMPDVTWTSDLYGNTVFISQNVERVYGYTPEDLYREGERLWFGRVHPLDLARVKEAYEGLFAEEREFDVEYRIQRKDGEWIWLHDRATAAYEKEGVRYADGLFSDVTERKLLEEQLSHAHKMEAIGTLAGGIAHDFNNILTAIVGYATLLQMKMEGENPLAYNVGQILAAAERAAALTQSLLAFSRKQPVEPKPVKVNEVIGRAEKLLARLIGEDVELRILPAEDDLTVMADAARIEQVLMNMATNARDAMPTGGVLTIGASPFELDPGFIRAHGYGRPGRYALISVTDTGMGMEGKTRERIFEPFFTTKETGRGTGLGLSIAFGILKQHNGYINCYSEPGKGTTFRIYLPLTGAMGGEIKEKEVPVSIRGGAETILLAEDDAAVRKLTRELLEEFGYTVIEAENGKEAVEKFRENRERIRLLLFDLTMPKMGGREALGEVRKEAPDVSALFMSGYPADTLSGEIREWEAEVVLKPVSPTALLRKVREAIER